VFHFSKRNLTIQGANQVNVTGLSHLALAAYAYLYFERAEQVLLELIQLFTSLTLLTSISARLTEEIHRDLMVKIQA
jgi:hypothetical protein